MSNYYDKTKILSDDRIARNKIGDESWAHLVKYQCGWCETPIKNSLNRFWKMGNICQACSDQCSRTIRENQHRNEENRQFLAKLLDPNRKYEIKHQRRKLKAQEKALTEPTEE